MRSLQRDSKKLIVTGLEQRESDLLLFDLGADRAEQHDFAPDRVEEASRWRQRLDAVFEQYDRQGFPRVRASPAELRPVDVEALRALGYAVGN